MISLVVTVNAALAWDKADAGCHASIIPPKQVVAQAGFFRSDQLCSGCFLILYGIGVDQVAVHKPLCINPACSDRDVILRRVAQLIPFQLGDKLINNKWFMIQISAIS